MNKKNIVRAIGCDLSTTALSLAGLPEGGGVGDEVFVSIPMRGATSWHGQPAFDLNELPGLFTEALGGIKAQGFEFAKGGVISGSVRQHDLVVLGANGRFLLPALSWQCNAATEEVKSLREKGAEAIVGRLEPRLILPKLLWALKQEPSLNVEIDTVMTTGDFIAMQLTGVPTLCSSEALSNGLLVQNTREFAADFLNSIAELYLHWFPQVVKSGQAIQPMPVSMSPQSADWNSARLLLPDWQIVAGLGDNHAGAVGSGLVGRDTIVISAGTSGTVTRAVKLGTPTTGSAMQFEYFDDTLLLLMMGECASWYNRFISRFTPGNLGHATLNDMAEEAKQAYYIEPPETPETPFPAFFTKLPLGEQVRSLQFSIAMCLAAYFKKMQQELLDEDAEHAIQRVVLTGGLTNSEYFCEALKKDLRAHGFEGEILVSNRVGPLANQAATLGALINAMVGVGLYPSLEAAIKELCPAREI